MKKLISIGALFALCACGDGPQQPIDRALEKNDDTYHIRAATKKGVVVVALHQQSQQKVIVDREIPCNADDLKAGYIEAVRYSGQERQKYDAVFAQGDTSENTVAGSASFMKIKDASDALRLSQAKVDMWVLAGEVCGIALRPHLARTASLGQ